MFNLITVIIPVYNHAHTLKKCLLGVLRQTHRPLEVIIINDGSTDSPERELMSLRDINLKFISQPHRGAPPARNRGLREAAGDYVIFWDADTLAEPRMLETMLTALNNNPNVAYAYSRFKFGWKTMNSGPFDAARLKKNNYIDVTTLIRRRDCAPFDENLRRFQDWDLWLTLLEKNKTGVFVPEVLYKKLTGKRKGISRWLPSFVYKLPWKLKAVREYEQAREIVLKKHRLN